MQHTKVSYELIQNYISSSRDTEKDSPDPASAIENRLMREIVRENLTKRQKCYIIMYYTKGMTMQEIADAEGVSKSTVSRTIGLARKRISCGRPEKSDRYGAGIRGKAFLQAGDGSAGKVHGMQLHAYLNHHR